LQKKKKKQKKNGKNLCKKAQKEKRLGSMNPRPLSEDLFRIWIRADWRGGSAHQV